ncbi:MAG TPA: class I tRNA ligase family protein, partial [Dermatophilaceae bacterium]|nr:class I tRNA ligase family protein [Dermatophilaceae bacterium]
MRAWAAPEVPRVPGSGPPLWLHDSSSGVPFRPAAGTAVGLYVCGITPYDATHLGHAATYVTFDVVVRVLLDAGHTVRYVQNITDVDDPLLERATRDGIDWRDLADREIQLFRDDMTALRVIPPDDYVGVVERLPHIEQAVTALVDGGLTYDLPVHPTD